MRCRMINNFRTEFFKNLEDPTTVPNRTYQNMEIKLRVLFL